jgi:hypothetical protein
VHPDPPLAGSRANAAIFCISARSIASPMARRTGDSIEIAPTPKRTRPLSTR